MKHKLFMDPVYDEFVMIEKGGIGEKIISSPLMQRLRYIRQLGPCYFVYPGAEHTRFQHSLGVYWLVTKAFGFLKKKGYTVDENLKFNVQIAALTHDLGHSPYSHALERKIVPYNHEELTLKALEMLEAEGTVKSEIVKQVKQIIKKEFSVPFGHQLISSQLDCDRLDYLRRDAFHTGVSFGKVDVNRILASIEIADDNLVWNYKGFNALESYVMSRYQMYWTVYFHPVNISAQVLLQKMLKRLRILLSSGTEVEMDALLKETIKTKNVEKFFMLTDASIISSVYQFTLSKDPILKDLGSRFVKRYFFRAIEIESPQIVLEAREKLIDRGFDPEYYMDVIEPSKVAYSYYSPEKLDAILVKMNDRIEEVSNIAPTDALKALSRRVKKALLFIPPEVELK
ncbi:HD domain-containing protein [Desulfurobacterium sp.]